MKKNTAGQVIGAQMVSATDGSAFTSTVSVLVTGDGGTQGAGGGTVTHEGNGFHSYTPTQAETNYDHIAFTFTGTGAVSATVQVYTGTPQTGDSYARLGAPAGASIAADIATRASQTSVDTVDDFLDTEIAAIKAKTDNLPSDPADASDVAASFSTVNTTLSTIAGYLDTEIAAIKAKTDNLPADPADASDIASAFSTVNTTLATLGTYIDTEVAAIKAKTDNLPADPADASDIAASFSSIASTLATMATYIDTEVAAIKAKTDALPASPAATGDAMTLAANSITAAVIATDAIDSDALAASALTEVQASAAAALTAYDPPTRAEATADKDEIISEIGGISGGGSGLTGPRSVTLTWEDENNDAVPLVDFTIMAGASVVGSGRATEAGTFAFGLEDGTYTVVSNTTNGIAFENATLVVNGTETLTITGEGVSIPASADPLRCACYLYSRTVAGEIEAGISHVFRLSALPSGNGNSYGADIVETSGTDGLLEIDLLRGKTYLMQRGTSWVNEDTDTVTVNVPNSAGPFELPNVWSVEN